MLEVAWIGFILLAVGSFLLLACGWIQIYSHHDLLKNLAGVVFEGAGLAGIGGALVMWVSLVLYGFQQSGIQINQSLVRVLAIAIGGTLTVITYKPFIDWVRKWLRLAMPQGTALENKLTDAIERIRKL